MSLTGSFQRQGEYLANICTNIKRLAFFFYIIIDIEDNVYSVKNSTLLFHQNVCKQTVPWSTLAQPERGLGVEKGDLKEARPTIVRKTQLAV